MGYSHYWKTVGEFTPSFQESVKKLVLESPVPLGQAVGSSMVVAFNGIGHDAHEPFRFVVGDRGFCKTNRKPYDLIVVAVLALAQHFRIAEVSSDGGAVEWKAGVDLASSIIGKPVSIPWGVLNQ